MRASTKQLTNSPRKKQLPLLIKVEDGNPLLYEYEGTTARFLVSKEVKENVLKIRNLLGEEGPEFKKVHR